MWAVLILHQSQRHKQILTRVKAICQDFHSQSLLHLAAREGQIHHLRRLLDGDEQVNAETTDYSGKGQTPLMLAARFNDEEVIEFLIERGASPEMEDYQHRTSFNYAAEGGKVRNVLRLIERGVNVLQTDESGYSALHLAASNGHTNVVRLLIEHGADVNEVARSSDNSGCTPLMLAAEKGHLRTVQVLLQNEAYSKKENGNAWLPLHSAAKGDNPEVLKFLLKRDGNVLAVTNLVTTVLHLATTLDLVMTPVDHGAKIQARYLGILFICHTITIIT